MRVSGWAAAVVRRRVVVAVVAVVAVTGTVLGAGAAPVAAAVLERAPFITHLTGDTRAVTVGFRDQSTAEDAFQLFRRGLTGFWEYVGEAPTTDKPGQRSASTLVDPSPNGLRCYLVVAYDYAGVFQPARSREECLHGGGDPFDTRPGVPVAAPRVSSVQTQSGPDPRVRINYVDRSLNESRFKLFVREGGTALLTQILTTSRTSVGRFDAFVVSLPAGARNPCYTVEAVDDVTGAGNVSNEVCITSPAPLPTPPAGRFSANFAYEGPLAVSSQLGGESAVAVGTDGMPIIAFRARGPDLNPWLYVTHCTDAACESWETARLDRDGTYPSIAIGRDGLPVVSYRSVDGVRLAHCSDRSCFRASLSTVDRVDWRHVEWPAVTIGADGFPTIAYEDTNSFGDTSPDEDESLIKVVRCRDAACATPVVNGIDLVRTSRHSGQGLAVATSSVTGQTYVAYAEKDAESDPAAVGERVLTIAVCLDTACTRRRITPVAQEFRAGSGMSMAIGRDGLPVLSYVRQATGSGGFVFARCANILCTGVNTTYFDNPDGDSLATSAAVGADGLPLIAFRELGKARIKVRHCTDVACSSASDSTLPIAPLAAGTPSIAIGADGLPVISFATDALFLVHCRDVACLEGPTGPVVGIGGMCAEVLLASTDNGTPIQLRPCSGHTAQNWETRGDGTLRALGKCLTVAGAGTANGTPIQLHDCDGGGAGAWEPRTDGTLRNPGSGKCLDTASHSGVDFIRLVLWECTPGIPSQSWSLPSRVA